MIQNDSLSPLSHSDADENLWLEVRRGQTRAPRRAVRTRRFLIGAGSNCQLQLGGDDVPILHSILLVDEDGAQIDAVVPSPELFVNGVPHRAAQLRDGDVLSIGKFEFAVHIQQPVDADAGQECGGMLSTPNANLETDLADLSATEIVNRLEQDLREIGRLQSSRETGAEALLQAARHFGGEQLDAEETSVEEAVLLQLQELSRSLQQRVNHAIDSRTGAGARRQSAFSVTGGDETPAAAIATDVPSRRKAS